jgi:hypothetical protein
LILRDKVKQAGGSRLLLSNHFSDYMQKIYIQQETVFFFNRLYVNEGEMAGLPKYPALKLF